MLVRGGTRLVWNYRMLVCGGTRLVWNYRMLVCGRTRLACGNTVLNVVVIVLMILFDRCSHIVIVTAIVITTDVQLSRNATIRHFLNLS